MNCVMTTDEKYMLRCLQLARLGEYYVAPNPMVGAVLVRNGIVIGEGWHRQYGGPHAEVNCFQDAERNGGTDFSDSTLYVSLEPCSHYGKTPPCAELIIRKKVKRVVAGMSDPNPQVSGRGLQMLREAGIEVECGVKEKECRQLNRRFACLHTKHRPYVILKWAQTADGFIDAVRNHPRGGNTEGMAEKVSGGREPLVISTGVTKQLVHQMRAENMAIMVGTRTALMDNPRLLTTRWAGRNPARVVPDRHSVIPSDSRIFSPDAETVVYRERTDFPYILSDLAGRGIHSLMVEGGAALLNHILQTGLYDEVHIEISPVRIGDGVPAPHFPISGMQEVLSIDGHCLYQWQREMNG